MVQVMLIQVQNDNSAACHPELDSGSITEGEIPNQVRNDMNVKWY